MKVISHFTQIFLLNFKVSVLIWISLKSVFKEWSNDETDGKIDRWTKMLEVEVI